MPFINNRIYFLLNTLVAIVFYRQFERRGQQSDLAKVRDAHSALVIVPYDCVEQQFLLQDTCPYDKTLKRKCHMHKENTVASKIVAIIP